MPDARGKNPALVEVLAGGLRAEFGLADDEAIRIARNMVRWIGKLAGGDVFYCPKTVKLDRIRRREAIRREFNGRNRDELCRRYRISRSTFYSIIGGRAR
ncbi:hypothetical protein LLG90_04805 [Aromatoleum toluclasticum]|uniref:Mor transcription activator family protein n=1 Tax=Aromatoleum toluclasticum TaxID=92003 RepID=UPI001D18F27B|nr:Mor transcription activator family protein [Aromatoleum toluclasticum]MCC4114669.1 hypothetical protein [Aromatoleum toluclasticum]